MCPHSYEAFGDDLDVGILEQLEKVDLKSVQTVELCGLGEPFLSPQLLPLFRRFHQAGCTLDTTSNGTVMTQAIAEEIVRFNLVLSLSIDGATQETFEWVRPRLKFEKLLRTLNLLKESAEKTGSETQYRLQFYVLGMVRNIHELPDIVSMASKYHAQQVTLNIMSAEDYPDVRGHELWHYPELTTAAIRDAMKRAEKLGVALDIPDVYKKIYFENQGSVAEKPLESFVPDKEMLVSDRNSDPPTFYVPRKEKAASGSPRIATTNIEVLTEGNSNTSSPSTGKTCRWPWESFVLTINGSVNPCYARIDMGDLNQSGFKEIWQCERYEILRKSIHSHNPPKMCQRCPYSFGINGGDPEAFDRSYTHYTRVPASDFCTEKSLLKGFHHVERDQQGNLYCWMSDKGTLKLIAGEGARFLVLEIFPELPVGTLNLGRARVDGHAWEPFETSSDRILVPIPEGNSAATMICEIEMFHGYRFENDERVLGLGLRGISVLYDGD